MMTFTAPLTAEMFVKNVVYDNDPVDSLALMIWAYRIMADEIDADSDAGEAVLAVARDPALRKALFDLVNQDKAAMSDSRSGWFKRQFEDRKPDFLMHQRSADRSTAAE